ncbi:MAG: glycosyltransferase family 2 protein [Deltaproteobacteria bacterium]|nr:MAG: glycosyltransferase family 2 protein [Deltaproteobacteria bacterium]
MDGFLVAAMAAVLLLIGVLLIVGSRALERAKSKLDLDSPGPWPAAALIVPVAGAASNLAANLRSLLTQDYPDYQVIFVTRDQSDLATRAIAALIPEHPRSRLILSGPASQCGQKNHNLLAGVQAAGEEPEILVFCDSTRLAHSNWLKGLVLPLVKGEAPVVSGYHHVLPQDGSFAAWGRAVTVSFLFLTKGIARCNQPWGGATAISRRLFEDLGVRDLWAHNVVDDVSLAMLLQEKGLRVVLASGESLMTPISGDTLATWGDWAIRQWIYLKFCLPGSWLALGLFFYLLSGLVLWAGVRIAAAAVSSAPISAWPEAAFLGALTGMAISLKDLHPQPPRLRTWLPAFYAAIFMGAWCHLCNWPMGEIHWRGISYRVGWKGRVLGISNK